MRRIAAASIIAALLCLGVEAQDVKGPIPIDVPKRDKPVDFRADILPFLKTNCIACHHAKDPEGALVLETVKSLLKGGDTGPGAIPGKSAESLVLISASYAKKPVMPPRKNKVGAGTLTPQQLGLLKLWIDQGCKESTSAEVEAPRWQPVTSAWHPIYAVGLDTEGQFAACGRAGHLFLYHVPTARQIDQPSDPKLAPLVAPGQPGLADRDAILAIAFSPDGNLLATGGYRAIRLWKKEQPEAKSKIALTGEPKVLAISPDGKKIAYAAADPVIRIVNLTDGKPLAELKGHAEAITSLRYSADGKQLLSASTDKTVRVWKLADGTLAGKIETPAALSAAEWIAEGKQVATAGPDGLVRLWTAPDAATLAEGAPKAAALKEIKTPAIDVRAAFGGLLSVTADGKLSLWNLETLKAAKEAAHGGPVSAIAVSPDGKRWISIGGPAAVLWNGEDGKKIADLKTDGPAERRDRATASLLAFAANEVTFRTNAVKGLQDTKTKEEAEVKVAADAVAPAEKNLKDKNDAYVKASADRYAADVALGEAYIAVEAAKDRLELALNQLAITDPETALRQADADTTASLQYLDGAAKHPKMAIDAKLRTEAAQRMLQFGLAGVAYARVQAAKAAADQKLAEATAAPKVTADAQVKAATDAKAKAEAAKKAVDEAKKKLESVTAEPDKKAAEEALKKLEGEVAPAAQAAEKAEQEKNAAVAAAAESVKKLEEAKAAAASATAAVTAAKTAFDAAQKAITGASATAEAAIKTADAAAKAALPKKDTAKKAEDAAQGAVEIAKANLESAKGRVEKAKESVIAQDKQIAEANAKLEAEKQNQAKLDADRKAAAEALTKAKLPFRTAGFSADGALALLGAEDGRLFTFGAATGIESAMFPAHAKAVVAVGGTGVSLSADGALRTGAWMPTWKLQVVMEPSESTKPPIDRVLSLAFSPDGKMLASGGGVPSRDGELLLWNAADGTLLREITGAHSDTVFDLAFTPDGSLLASAGADKFARVFDVKTGKLIKSFEGHTNHVLGVAWNRTGRTLATSGADDVIKVWNLESGQQIRTIPGFTKQATALRYVGYDSTFAVAAGGTAVRLVNEGGNVVRNFESAGAFMYDLSLSADGRTIVAGGLDGVLRLWSVADGKSLAVFAPAGPAPAPPAK